MRSGFIQKHCSIASMTKQNKRRRRKAFTGPEERGSVKLRRARHAMIAKRHATERSKVAEGGSATLPSGSYPAASVTVAGLEPGVRGGGGGGGV